MTCWDYCLPDVSTLCPVTDEEWAAVPEYQRLHLALYTHASVGFPEGVLRALSDVIEQRWPHLCAQRPEDPVYPIDKLRWLRAEDTCCRQLAPDAGLNRRWTIRSFDHYPEMAAEWWPRLCTSARRRQCCAPIGRGKL